MVCLVNCAHTKRIERDLAIFSSFFSFLCTLWGSSFVLVDLTIWRGIDGSIFISLSLFLSLIFLFGG